MKQLTVRFIVSILVLLSIMLITRDSSAQNRPRHFVADTGVINLTPNRKLRVTVTPTSDNETHRIRYRRCLYTEQNGVFVATSTMISPFMMLPSNEARFFDVFVGDLTAVRARVASSSPKIVVTFQLIDTSTGEIVWADEAVVSEQDLWAT